MTSADDYVIQLALDHGLLQPAALDEICARLKALPSAPALTPAALVGRLAEEGLLDAGRLAALLAVEFGLRVVDLSDVSVSAEALAALPRELAVRHQVFPLEKSGRTLKVAITDPLETDGLDSLAHRLKLTLDPCLATPAGIRRAIERHYGDDGQPLDRLFADFSVSGPLADAPATGTGNENEPAAPVNRLVHAIISEAVRRRASDIHIEPLAKRLRVRYRIDGVLHEVRNPPKRLQPALVSRLKIMADISIVEKRIPQDGRIRITSGGRALDLRVATLPTAHGESVVMRILDKESLKPGLPELGFSNDDRAEVERLIALPHGIVLVTGPTGSGKTTTLYSCLHHLNQPDRKIITVEDPVEYQLDGINQVPVRADTGLTFASALRAMLRQAPNIVMIGEIRDLETAEIAFQASLTGHLVFSTLHTNDAPGAVTRLLDIGVKPFLVATALRATLAQRLVRKICPHCRQPHPPGARELHALNLGPAQAAATFMKGRGCPACHGTGYHGRIGLFEIFVVNDEIQHLIYGQAGTAQLRQKARQLGMRTLREDGICKATAGLTTLEEVVSITAGDAT